MKNCPKCLTEHTRPGLYCSRGCANSRIFSEESKKKKSDANKKFFTSLDDKSKEIINERLRQAGMIFRGMRLDSLLKTPFEDLKNHNKRKRVIVEQNFKCGCCGIEKWLDKPITFELEHIDGNHNNNERHNLIALCPNCHSMSFSWRGRKNANDKTAAERLIVYKELLKMLP